MERQERPKLFVIEIGWDTVKGAGLRLVSTAIPLVSNALTDFPVNPQKLCLESCSGFK